MSWGKLLGVTAVVAATIVLEWPGLRAKPLREKAAFATLAAMGWGLAVLLIIYPNLPSPTRWVTAFYSPFGKLLEK